ncbi:unnamed protein product [Closterium sp. Yama58-4]|nr:unnamed protein product [Closterium sp. Yama58-4]
MSFYLALIKANLRPRSWCCSDPTKRHTHSLLSPPICRPVSDNYLHGATVPKPKCTPKTLSVSDNYLYAGTVPKPKCTSKTLTLSLGSNCFPAKAIPCGQPQRPAQQCSAFCSLSPPSTLSCGGQGYCFWKGEQNTGTATCVCNEGFGNGVDPGTCLQSLPELECGLGWVPLLDALSSFL